MVLNDTIINIPEALASLLDTNWTLAGDTPEIDVVYDLKRLDHSGLGEPQDTVLVSQVMPERDDGAIDIGYNAYSKHWDITIHVRTTDDRSRLNALYGEVRRIIMENRQGFAGLPGSASSFIEWGTANDLSFRYVGIYRIDIIIMVHSLFGKIDPPV